MSADWTVITGAVTAPPKLASRPLSMLAETVAATGPAKAALPVLADFSSPVETGPETETGPASRTGVAVSSAE